MDQVQLCVCVTEDLANFPATEFATQKIDKKCKPGFGLVFDGSDFLIIAFQTAVTAVKRQQILRYHISQHVKSWNLPLTFAKSFKCLEHYVHELCFLCTLQYMKCNDCSI